MPPSRDFAAHEPVVPGASLPQFVPVLIVGGGPVGLLQGLLLSRHGVPSLVIERYDVRLAVPKAHALNPRSLKILRQYGLGERHFRRLGTSRADARWVNFVTNLSGELIGRIPYERMDAAVLEDTPEMIHNVPQRTLENELTGLVAQDRNITFRNGFSTHAVERTGDTALATIEERHTGKLHKVQCQHLVGCDGHKSTVRQLLDISSEGEDTEQTMMTIHFNANLLPVLGDRVGMLFWIMDPAAAGFIIAYDLSGTLVHISEVDVTRQPVESWTEEMCRVKVRDAIGQDVPLDILSFRPWAFRRQIATTFQKENVFLAGDAAHSFPPTGGLGLNCGIADAHNLAYKIALVQQGVATPSILETYTAERRRVADAYSKQRVKNGRQIFALLQSLGTGGVEDGDQARRTMMAALADPVQRAKVREGIEGQREHFDNLELHIGYVYDAHKRPAHASHYSPMCVPGARLPHAWISFSKMKQKYTQSSVPSEPVDVSYVAELNEEQALACQWSTLDLCGPCSWTLILGNHESCRVSAVSQFQKHCEDHSIHLNIWHMGKDFEIVRAPWLVMELTSNGGFLVRPDQHILMRITKNTTGGEMVAVLNGHFSLE